MNEETKKKLIKFTTHFWYVFVILAVGAFAVVMYQNNQDNKRKLIDLKRQINITEDIVATESRLKEVRDREVQYQELSKNQTQLLKSLEVLDKKNKELEKRKKEVIKNEIEKYTTTDLHNAFNSLGINNTITSGK